MKKSYSLILLALLCFVLSGYGQQQIYILDFESAGGYTTSISECTDGSGDYFIRTDGSNIGGSYSNIQDSNFFAGQDIDASGCPAATGARGTLNINDINVSGFTNLQLRVYVAEDDANDGQNDWDSSEFVHFDFDLDNTGSFTNLLHFESFGNSNTAPGVDSDFNGVAEGTTVTDTFVQFTQSITGTGNLLDLRVVFDLNAGDEDFAIDNIEIWGVASGGPTPTITVTPNILTGFTYVEGGTSGEQSFDVSGSDLTNDITITPPTNWEISSTSGGPYQTTAITLTQSGGTVSNTPIYTRMVSGLLNVNSPFSGNISCSSSGATTRNVAVDGTVTLPAPANDDCSGAISLTTTTSCGFASYTNVNATNSGLASPSCQSNTGLDVWFSTVVPASGEITVETSANGGLTDTILAIYTGTCGSLTEVACDDDGAAGASLMSLVTASSLTVGSTVYIRVLDFGGNDTGTFDICVTTSSPCVAPTGQPTALSFSNITNSSIDGSFTATTADEYLVVVSTSSTLSANPIDGTTYTNGDSLGGGTVVQSSNATTFTASGLSPTTQYYFFVFAYNNSSCAGGPAFNVTSPLTNDETTIAGPCLSTAFENADGWSDHAYGNWTDTDVNGDVWTGNSIFAGNAGNRRIQMNDVGDWLELPTVDNPTSLTYMARISSPATGTNSLTVQYFNGSAWIDLVVHTSTSTIFELFTADLTTISVLTNVRLRLYRNADNRSHYVDDLNVYCGPAVVGPELQLVDDSSAFQNCGYTIDFANVSTDMTSDIDFTIENLGNQPLDITSFNITGDFTINPSVATMIPATSSETFTITFSPGSVGTLNGLLTITSNDTDEASCTINLTGEGYIGTEEIRVETSAANNIPDGAGIAPVYDNNFGNEVEGQTTASKTYLIENLGDGDLDLTSISVSTTEFTITSNPAPLALSPGESTPLLIAFSPSTPGTKNATVTINNSDSDENPFTFAVTGVGTCSAGIISFLPGSGPTGTIVNITGTDFGGSTIATIKLSDNSDFSMPVTVISATEIQVTIPNDAQTSSLEVTNDLGCAASEIFTVFTEDITTCEGNTGSIPAGWTGLMISGLFDNSGGSCHYLELFNPTGSPIVLTGNYEIGLSNNFENANDNMPMNGSAFTFNGGRQGITGTVPAYSTFMIRFGNTGDTCNDCPSIVPDDTIEASSFGVNGNSGTPLNIDRIFLVESSTNYVDFWANSDYGSAGYVYTRDLAATAPFVPAEFPVVYDSAANWDSQGTADCFGFTIPDFSAAPTVTTQPSTPANNCDLTYAFMVAADEGFINGNPLAYQWYYSAPGDMGWTIITNGATYSGATSDTLNILNAVGLNNYQYYCEVREDLATCFTASNAATLIVNATIWDGSDWTNSTPPDEFTIAIIDGPYDTSANGDIDACQLIINSGVGRTLNVANSGYVRVVNNVTNNGTITVQTHGAFVQDGIGVAGSGTSGIFTNNGTASVIKQTELLNDWYEYTYWSSPVLNQALNAATPNTPDPRRFYFETANYLDEHTVDTTNGVPDDIDDSPPYDWQNASGDTMELGRGYAATSSPMGLYPGTDQATFEGDFFTGDLIKSVLVNGFAGDNDWNFIGNPYPSAINFNDLHTENNTIIEGAAYLWSHALPPLDSNPGNEPLNFNQADYAVITVGSGNTAGGSGVIPAPGNFIPSGQGFFVRAINSGGNLRFTNAMRRADNTSNNQFFRSGEPNSSTSEYEPNRLWVNLTTDSGVFNQILVAYVDGATDGEDSWSYDAPRNLASGLASVIYTTIEDVDTRFAIQGKTPTGLDLEEIIPVGFKTEITQPTIYKLSIAQLEGDFLSNNTIYLRDRLMDVIHNLSENDYAFTSEAGEFNNRFEIVFQPQSLSITENEVSPNDVSIVELGDGEVKISVGKNLTIKHVEILDIVGRTIYKLQGNNASEVYNLSRLSQATYIARVTLSNGQIISKKAVKRK